MRSALGIYENKAENFKQAINKPVMPNPPPPVSKNKKDKSPKVTDKNGLPIDKKNLQKVSNDRNTLINDGKAKSRK